MSVRIGADLRRPETQLRLFRGRARAAVLVAEEAVQQGGGGAGEAMVGAAVELGRWVWAVGSLKVVLMEEGGAGWHWWAV